MLDRFRNSHRIWRECECVCHMPHTKHSLIVLQKLK